MFVYHIFMTSPLWLVVGRSSVSMSRIIYTFLNVCPFDYPAVAVSGQVDRSFNGIVMKAPPPEISPPPENLPKDKVFPGNIALGRISPTKI